MNAVTDEVYRTRTIKRDRRSRAEIGQLDRQILEILSEDHPQSVRHVFYRMSDPRLPEPVEKSDRGYRHVQDRCVKLRRAGMLPYGWISDASRRGYFTPTYGSASEFLRGMASLYRGVLWQHSNWYCEVWAESRSIAGVIQSTCSDLAVNLYPAGGFSSITLAFDAAENINETCAGHGVQIFYIGDYDPAGVLIDVAIEKEIRKHLRPGIELLFDRIAITVEQIQVLDLPTKPRKANDRRALHVECTVEAEAMPAHLLRSLLRQSIEALLSAGGLQVVSVAEDSEREQIERMAMLLDGTRPS